jgi:hypothetical protein
VIVIATPAKTPNISKTPSASTPRVTFRKPAPSILWHQFWRRKLKEILLKLLSRNSAPLSADDIEVRVRAFVIIMVTLVFAFITFALLYSVTFVTQPIKQMAPIDQAYTKMLNDIVLLIVGGIGGILTKGVSNEAKDMMNAAKANTAAYVAPPPPPPAPVVMMAPTTAGWTPPPAPVTPPNHLESDEERAAMAAARQSVKV